MTRSLIIPRLTTSRPRSGSWIADSTVRTCSELGGLRGPRELTAQPLSSWGFRYWALNITAARSASTPSRTRMETTSVSVPARAMTAEPPEGSPRMRMCPLAATSDAPIPTRASNHKGRKGSVGPAVPAAMIVMKNATSSTSSSIEKYPSASCMRPRLNAPFGRYRVRSAIRAAEPLKPDARNRPPSIQVSLQIGWLLTLSSTPVYDATNRAKTPPMTLNAWPKTPPIGRPGSPTVPRSRRSSTNDSSAETAAKKPKIKSAQTPTDIGDQYLKLRPVSPGVTSTSMCQNFHQLEPRSVVRSTGQTSRVTKLA